MGFPYRDLFRVRTPVASAPNVVMDAVPSTPSAPTSVFVTPQALLSFPVASAVVFGGWKLAIRMNWTSETRYTVPVVLAFLWAAYLFLIDISDPQRTTKLSFQDYLTKFVVAAANGTFLAASALGINTVAGAPPGSGH